MKTKLTFIATIFLLHYAQLSSGQDGGTLFKANCGACHTIGKGKLVGPDLLGVNDRHPESWSLKWIKSSQKMVQAGDPEAVRLFNENNGMPMTDQPLKDSEIKSVLAFIQVEGAAQAVKPVPTETPVSSASINSAEPKIQSASILNQFSMSEYLLFAALIFMVVVIYVLCSTLKLMSSVRK